MKIRMAYLIQAVFALVVAGALSFGASHAFASEEAALQTCTATGYPYADAYCGFRCSIDGQPGGYCDSWGYCQCGDIP